VKVFILEPISDKAVAYLCERCEVVDWRDPAAVRRWPEEADGLVVRIAPIAADDVRRAARLKAIGKHGVGIDNIPVAVVRERGIAVVNTPGANADAVAELALGLALVAARHVVAADRGLRAGRRGTVPTGRELAGRTLGVVGFGQVGRRTAALFARALGTPVLAYDPGLPPAVMEAAGARACGTLDELLAGADIVSLHLPLTPASRHLIGRRELGLMRPAAILVNVARGGIVDEAALAEALASGRPAAAASDVFAEEPPPPDHPLLRLENFIATPHIGMATEEALDRVGLLVAEQVVEILAGKAPRHPV
jgi:D-3-phosphoglycerate dehydrogenase / 2-oxoglutarate reductase